MSGDLRLGEVLSPGRVVEVRVLRKLGEGTFLASVDGVRTVVRSERPLSVGEVYSAFVEHLGEPAALRLCGWDGIGVDLLV